MATSALAIDAADIINRMETRGYIDITTSKTLFGNTSIVGIINGLEHEFIISKSGVVLRENLQDEDDKDDRFTWPWDDDDDNSWKEKADADDSWDDDKDAEYEQQYRNTFVDIDDNDQDDAEEPSVFDTMTEEELEALDDTQLEALGYRADDLGPDNVHDEVDDDDNSWKEKADADDSWDDENDADYEADYEDEDEDEIDDDES
jgi:hypothetical protein